MAEYAELAPFGVRVPGQNYALVSFVSPESAQRSPMSGFRIYGCFETMEEAKAHAEKANRADDAFDIYVAEMYRWCPWYPNPMDVQDPVYSDPQLDTMLREHRAAQVSAQTAFDERVAGALKEKALREDQTREETDETREEAREETQQETRG
jgi:ABC-type oligopeptide transport system substrate-binding subunit